MARASAFTWQHSDPAGLLAVSDAALARARAQDWTSGPMAERVAHLRALCARTAAACASIAHLPLPPPGATTVTIELEKTRAPRADFTTALLRTPMLLAPPKLPVPGQFRAVSTVAGNAATQPSQDAGNPFLAGVVIVVSIVASAAALCYVAQVGAELVDNHLSRVEATRRMVATQANAVELAEKHSAAEIAAGKTIPLSAAEQQVLDSLNATQRELAAQQERAIPNPWKGIGGGLSTVGIVIGLAVVAVIALRQQ